jgi:sec-independent protein translocase protein TatA
MGAIQPWHIILIVVVFLLLFGGKKLPDAARGLGRSLRILKSEVGAMHDEDASKTKVNSETETEASAAFATPASMIAPAPVAQQPTAATSSRWLLRLRRLPPRSRRPSSRCRWSSRPRWPLR